MGFMRILVASGLLLVVTAPTAHAINPACEDAFRIALNDAATFSLNLGQDRRYAPVTRGRMLNVAKHFSHASARALEGKAFPEIGAAWRAFVRLARAVRSDKAVLPAVSTLRASVDEAAAQFVRCVIDGVAARPIEVATAETLYQRGIGALQAQDYHRALAEFVRAVRKVARFL